MILSLPSVRQILFGYFRSTAKMGSAYMGIDQVREWLRGRGITADVRKAPELTFSFTPSPF